MIVMKIGGGTDQNNTLDIVITIIEDGVAIPNLVWKKRLIITIGEEFVILPWILKMMLITTITIKKFLRLKVIEKLLMEVSMEEETCFSNEIIEVTITTFVITRLKWKFHVLMVICTKFPDGIRIVENFFECMEIADKSRL